MIRNSEKTNTHYQKNYRAQNKLYYTLGISEGFPQKQNKTLRKFELLFLMAKENNNIWSSNYLIIHQIKKLSQHG